MISIAGIEICAHAFHLLPFNCYEILINSIKLQKCTRKGNAYFIIVREFNHEKRLKERESQREREGKWKPARETLKTEFGFHYHFSLPMRTLTHAMQSISAAKLIFNHLQLNGI